MSKSKLNKYFMARKPLLHIDYGDTFYVSNLVILNNIIDENNNAVEGVIVGYDGWYIDTQPKQRLLTGKIQMEEDGFFLVGNEELRKPLPEFGEAQEIKLWQKYCFKPLATEELFLEKQRDLKNIAFMDFGLKEKEGA
tara:strand:+ start:793 stop:1206 length:414 start_codon:yes stop_codon:yes gene_type:complete